MAYTTSDYMWSIDGNYNATTHLLWSMVFGIKSSGSEDPGTIGPLVYDCFTDAFVGAQSGPVVYSSWRCENLGTGATASAPLTDTATGGSNSMSSNQAMLFQHFTGLPGPSYRGKTYVPYVAGALPDTSDPSLWSAGTIDSYANILSTFASELADADPAMNLCVNSRKLKVLTPVTLSVLDHTVAQMGKRRYG